MLLELRIRNIEMILMGIEKMQNTQLGAKHGERAFRSTGYFYTVSRVTFTRKGLSH